MRLRDARIAATLLLGLVLPAGAQQPPPEPWHLRGSLGLNLSKTSTTPLRPFFGSQQGSDYSTAAGDLRLNLSGFLKDPRLLLFTLDLNGQRGSNSIEAGGYRNTLLSGGANLLFLPQRPFPLRFYYRNSQFDASGAGFDQDSDYSTLGFDWSLNLSQLPRLTLGFSRFTNDIRLPTSLSDISYRQRLWRIGVDDVWSGWEWGFGFDDYANVSNAIGGFALSSDFEEDLRVLGARVRRSFWERKAQLAFENRTQWRDTLLLDRGSTKSTDSYTHASLRVSHTPKLSTSYFYNYVRVKLRSDVPEAARPSFFGPITLLQPSLFNSHYTGGRLEYRLAPTLRFFEEIRYYRLTPPTDSFEARKSQAESLSGVAYLGSWRGLELGGSYVGRYQLLGTNFGNHADTFSHDVEARVGWGNVRRLRLLGSARYSKLNLVEQLGGFTEESRWRLQADTSRLPGLRLRFSTGRTRFEFLNLGGNTEQDNTDFSLQLDHKRFSLGLARTLGDGAGALFPSTIRQRTLISIRLPLDELIATPLLDRTTHATSANLILRLHRSLDFSANWRVESNDFAASEIDYRLAEVRARYRLGKFTFDAGLGFYRTEVLTVQGPSGTDIKRYFFRAVRDFMVF